AVVGFGTDCGRGLFTGGSCEVRLALPGRRSQGKLIAYAATGRGCIDCKLLVGRQLEMNAAVTGFEHLFAFGQGALKIDVTVGRSSRDPHRLCARSVNGPIAGPKVQLAHSTVHLDGPIGSFRLDDAAASFDFDGAVIALSLYVTGQADGMDSPIIGGE